jgi:hypothetical protein
MKPSSFGVPSQKKYPIDTKRRARNALARVAQHGTPAQKTQVRKRVKAKYPSIQVAGGKPGGKRKRGAKR